MGVTESKVCENMYSRSNLKPPNHCAPSDHQLSAASSSFDLYCARHC